MEYLVITHIDYSSELFSKKVRRDDALISYNGQSVISNEQLRALVASAEADGATEVVLEIGREGKIYKIKTSPTKPLGVKCGPVKNSEFTPADEGASLPTKKVFDFDAPPNSRVRDHRMPRQDYRSDNGVKKIVRGLVLIAVGVLIYLNGEQIAITLMGGEEQVLRDAFRFRVLDSDYRNKIKIIGHSIQGAYVLAIAVGAFFTLVGLKKN